MEYTNALEYSTIRNMPNNSLKPFLRVRYINSYRMWLNPSGARITET